MAGKRPLDHLTLHIHVAKERCDALFTSATAGMTEEVRDSLRWNSTQYRQIVRAEIERRLKESAA